MGGKRAVAKITPPWPPLRRRRGNEPTLCPLQAVVGAVVFPHSASDQTWAENFFFSRSVASLPRLRSIFCVAHCPTPLSAMLWGRSRGDEVIAVAPN